MKLQFGIISLEQQSSFLEAIFFTLVEEISFGTSKIDYFRTTITIFLLLSTLLTVVSIRNPNPSTDDTATLKRTIVAFIAHTNKCTRPNIRITNDTFPITFLTKPSNGYSRLLPAHDQIRMVLGHTSSKTVLYPSWCKTCKKFQSVKRKQNAEFIIKETEEKILKNIW